MSGDDERNPNAEWAYIFNVLGKESLRGVLFEVATSLEENDDERVVVVEFEDDKALEITEHVNQLESQLNT